MCAGGERTKGLDTGKGLVRTFIYMNNTTTRKAAMKVTYSNLDFFLTLATMGGWIFVKPVFVLAGRGYTAAAANFAYRSKVRAVRAERVRRYAAIGVRCPA